MANTLYPKAKERILTGAINLVADQIKAMAVSDGYTFSAAHQFVSDLGATKIGDAVTLENKSVTSGAFDADDVEFGALPKGPAVKAIVLYVDTGISGSSALLGYIDTVPGLPHVTNGGGIIARWSNGPSKIFAI